MNNRISTAEILTIIGILALLGVFLLTGCVSIHYTDPAGNQLEVTSFLKDINADKLSYSVMDGAGNGKTFDLSKYQSEVAPMMIQMYNAGFSAGKSEGK